MDRQTPDDIKTTFCCTRCGARVAMSPTCAGTESRCPECGQILVAPDPPAQGGDELALYDPRLLDVPKSRARPAPSDTTEDAYERLRAEVGSPVRRDRDEIPQRTLPWIIDILLYPLNKAGLTVLLISVGVPFLLRIVVRFFFFFMGSFPPMLVFWVMFIVVHWLVLAVLVLYMNWYVCECIRDSAAGAIRAADTTAATPGIGEMLAQAIRVLLSAALCLAPALIYLGHTGDTGQRFRILYGTGGFVFPMALLAMVMFDGLHGLNPLRVIRSILTTFFPYCVLAPFCFALCLLVPVAGYYLVKRWMLGSVLLFLAYYQLLIVAHLLGRFYWRNEERLNWDT